MSLPARDTTASLRWITGLLSRHGLEFAISGGFAARLYGATRALNDIDIDIKAPEGLSQNLRVFDVLMADVAPYIIDPPQRYVDARWDMDIMTLNHAGQEIDVGIGNDIRIFDDTAQIWRPMPVDFNDLRMMEVDGMILPVVQPRFLARYKSLLSGAHQKGDIAAALAYADAQGI